MRIILFRVTVVLGFALLAGGMQGQDNNPLPSKFQLDSADGMELVNAKAEFVSYRGQRAAHLEEGAGQKHQDGQHSAGQELRQARAEANDPRAGCPHGLAAEIGEDGIAVAVEIRRGPSRRRVGEGRHL